VDAAGDLAQILHHPVQLAGDPADLRLQPCRLPNQKTRREWLYIRSVVDSRTSSVASRASFVSGTVTPCRDLSIGRHHCLLVSLKPGAVPREVRDRA